MSPSRLGHDRRRAVDAVEAGRRRGRGPHGRRPPGRRDGRDAAAQPPAEEEGPGARSRRRRRRRPRSPHRYLRRRRRRRRPTSRPRPTRPSPRLSRRRTSPRPPTLADDAAVAAAGAPRPRAGARRASPRRRRRRWPPRLAPGVRVAPESTPVLVRRSGHRGLRCACREPAPARARTRRDARQDLEPARAPGARHGARRIRGGDVRRRGRPEAVGRRSRSSPRGRRGGVAPPDGGGAEHGESGAPVGAPVNVASVGARRRRRRLRRQAASSGSVCADSARKPSASAIDTARRRGRRAARIMPTSSRWIRTRKTPIPARDARERRRGPTRTVDAARTSVGRTLDGQGRADELERRRWRSARASSPDSMSGAGSPTCCTTRWTRRYRTHAARSYGRVDGRLDERFRDDREVTMCSRPAPARANSPRARARATRRTASRRRAACDPSGARARPLERRAAST